MNVRCLRKRAAISSTNHLSVINSSFIIRRSISDYIYYLTHYHSTLFIILIILSFCKSYTALENQFQVPLFSNHNTSGLSSTATNRFLNVTSNFINDNKSSSSLNISFTHSPTTANKTSNHELFNHLTEEHKYKNKLKLSFNSRSSNKSLDVNYLDKSLLNNKFKIDFLNSFLNLNRSLDRLSLDKDNYFVLDSSLFDKLDKNDLIKDKEDIFLNLTRIKLKRNLDRKRLDDVATGKLSTVSNNYINISDLYQNYQNWLQDPTKVSSINNQQLDNLKSNLVSNNETTMQATHDSTSMAMGMSILYIVIFITGVFGNLGTCIVILRNKYMRTATNYYLFSLSVSDLTLLIFGLPQDLFLLWRPYGYPFGESFCILRGFTSEASSNASVLTITAFTIERYLAICQPLRAHTMSKLNRVVKLVCLIWIASAVFALPLALQFGIKYEKMDLPNDGEITAALCTVKNPITYSFEISTIVFFVIPACLLTILYIKIGIHLRRSEKCITRQHVNNTQHSQSNLSPNESLLLATINAPSSPNAGGNNLEFNNNLPFSKNNQQGIKTKEDRSNSEEESLLKSNLLRKMVRSCSNLSLLSSLSLKLNLQSSQQNSSQLNSQINLHQINSQPNFQSANQTSILISDSGNENRKLNNTISSISSTTKPNEANENRLGNRDSNDTIVNVDGENKSKNEFKDEPSSRNKLISKLRNVIEEKDGEVELDEDAERMCMLLVKKVQNDESNQTVNNKNVNTGEEQSNELKSIQSSVNNKRKQFQKMSPFSTLDSSSSNGWTRAATGLSLTGRTNTGLHSQDSSVSLNVRRRNWRFFKNRHSTRTIHHSSSSRRAVVKMLVAVVVAFFGCWLPFHIQRIFAVVFKEPTEPQIALFSLLTNISGVTYYLSATINPILYSIMSVKFRTAFKETLQIWCLKSNSRRRRAVSAVVAANMYNNQVLAEDSSRGFDQGASQLTLNKDAQGSNRVSSIESKAQNK